MKQTIYGFILSAMVAFSSCSDKLDEKHDNPDAFTSSEIEYLFTKGALQTIAIDYVDTYNLTFRRLGVYLQTTARQEGETAIRCIRILPTTWDVGKTITKRV